MAPAQGIVTTIAGTGAAARGPDNVPAVQSALSAPASVAYDADGNLYVADANNNLVRRVDPAGTITAFAGNGQAGWSGDNGPARNAELNFPDFVLAGPDGSVYISDSENGRIRLVDRRGIITTIAGGGVPASGVDGMGPPGADLNFPAGLALDTRHNLYIADFGNNRVLRLAPDGTMATFAGTGMPGSDGDGGPAAQAVLSNPYGLALGPDGTLYIAGFDEQAIRSVTPDGIIHAVAGNGRRGFCGDGELATEAEIDEPAGLAVDAAGRLYFMDSGNSRIRRVSTRGFIRTLAGTGIEDFNGDGLPGPATDLNAATGITLAPDGALAFTDDANNRVRLLSSRLPGPFPGDLNGDGGVTAADATLALRFAAGLATPTPMQIQLGDVAPSPGTDGRPYGDGKLDVADAVRILRRAVGLAPDPWP